MDGKDGQMHDPVCGMNLTGVTDLAELSFEGRKFFFCGEGCHGRFTRDPAKFQQEPLLRLENLWKVFDMGGVKTEVLRGLSLNVWEGDFSAIIGASGSGKSTLLNMMGLLDRPTSGKIYMRGGDISKLSDEERAQLRSLTFGFVFQQYNLIPWLSAYENITIPLMFARKKIDEQELKKHFEDIGLGERMTHRPAELSGGEQQRTALLRAIVNDPKVILGDEPTGNLDSKTGDKILEMLIQLNKGRGKTLVIVTHDAGIAEKADEIITLKDGQMLPHRQLHKKIYTE